MTGLGQKLVMQCPGQGTVRMEGYYPGCCAPDTHE